MKKLILATFLFLALVLKGWSNLAETIPTEDRRALEIFFQTLLYNYPFGYTLFGAKPISVAISHSPKEMTSESAILKRGWEAWCRCQNQFPSTRFILKKCTLEGQELCITIINRPALVRAITENMELFSPIFKENKPEIIAQRICDTEESIFNIKNPHVQSLVGILLGFGKRNSINFQREVEIFQELNNRQSPPFNIPAESLPPLGQFFLKHFNPQKYVQKSTNSTPDLISEAAGLLNSRHFFELKKTSFLVEHFQSPRFAFWDNDAETSMLKESYEQTQSILTKAYANKPFLDITLQQWISEK